MMTMMMLSMIMEVDGEEKEETAGKSDESAGKSDEPLLGTFDLVILAAIAILCIYWFFLRKKKEETHTIKKLVMPAVTRVEDDTSFIGKMKTGGRNVVVFYGSQTGTAEEFANRLSKDTVRYGMKGMVADPEECSMEEIPKLEDIDNSLAIFCMATYGEGDPTDNAQEFFDWLQTGDESLHGVHYTVFGLGNKTYEHYNAMAIYVDKRLEELGASRVYQLGLGDDDANIEEDFLAWREGFWPTVCDYFGVTATGEDINMRQYNLTVHDEYDPARIFTGEPARLGSFNKQKPPFDAKNPFLAPVTINRELYKGGERSCMHIELDITGSRIRYEAGDHVAVYPINNTEIVNAIGKRLNVDLDTVFTLTNVDSDASKKSPFPCPCKYRTALSHYVDITSHPRTHVLKELADYAEEPTEKEFLLKMTSTSTESKELYSKWIVSDNRNILSILEDLPSVQAPVDLICELLPRLQARYYSISSSPKVHPTSIHVTAVLVDYHTPTGRHNKGVATSWLKTKQPINEDNGGTALTVPIYVRRSQFRLPFKPATPVIMIGPGSGIAPFRGFIQERHLAKSEGKPVGDTILYTGFRKKVEDFLYEEELQDYVDNNTLTELNVAFSREQEHKVYVQHLMKEKQEKIWKVLEAGGHFYVCGDAKNMARDVHKTLHELIEHHGGLSSSEAESYVKKLQSKGRYSCDVWS